MTPLSQDKYATDAFPRSPLEHHQQRKHKNALRRILGLTTLLSIGLLPGLAPKAFAGPDVDRIVATQAHIDSPRAHWENGNFVLRSEIAGNSDEPRIEKTVTWLGYGWDDLGQSTYTMEVPDKPAFRFLGKPHQVLYRSPAIPSLQTYAPAWVGMGASGNIPTEDFRDDQFTLDIIGFDGPGRMEMFVKSSENSARRILSSHDPRYRSFWMSKGNHTHNETTFTKPGRYEITYRVTARKKDGTLIASAPQTLPWQVGGLYPSDGLRHWKKAFEKAPTQAGPHAGTPTFSIKPYDYSRAKKVYDGDKYLADLTFSTGNEKDNGTAVVTIDGYYLTEFKVKNGSGGDYDMLGDLPSTYQVFYIPDKASGPTPRFRSQGIRYQRPITQEAKKHAEVRTSRTGPEIKKHTADPAPAFQLNEMSINSHITMTTEPTQDTNTIKVHLHSSDPHLHARIIGGGYSSNSDTIPMCGTEMIMGDDGNSDASIDVGACRQKKFILHVSPHPLIKGEGATLELAALDPSRSQTATAILGKTVSTDTHAPKPHPSQPTSPETQPDQPENSHSKNCTKAQPCIFTHGHLDVFHIFAQRKGTEKPTLTMNIQEDITGDHIQREPESVIMRVLAQTYTSTTKKSPQIGIPLYVLPQTQDDRFLWPGWDTQALRKSGLHSSKIHIDSIQAPKNAQLYMFTSGELGASPDKAYRSVTQSKSLSVRNGDVINVNSPSHSHLFWGFSHPGTYTITAHASAPLAKETSESRNGGERSSNTRATESAEMISSQPVTYRFVVEPFSGDPHVSQPSGDHSSSLPGDTPKPSVADSSSQTKPVESSSSLAKPEINHAFKEHNKHGLHSVHPAHTDKSHNKQAFASSSSHASSLARTGSQTGLVLLAAITAGLVGLLLWRKRRVSSTC